MNKPTKKTSIGGQALIEGVMMRGPQRSAMAVRHVSGDIVTEEWDTGGQQKASFWKWPIIRGVYNMIDSLRCGYKCLMRSVELSGWDEEVKSSADQADPQTPKKETFLDKYAMPIITVLSTVLGVALALGLFMYLPIFLYNLVAGALDDANGWSLCENRYLRALCEGLLRIVIFVGYLAAVSLMKDMRRVFMYHGAEHKTIFCYEHGMELTVENVRKEKRFHPRCGTSFMVLMLIVGVFISMFIPITSPVLRTLLKLLTLPLVVGVGYEMIKWAGRKDNAVTRAISKPGVWVQHLTTREPDDSMIECAIAALLPTIPKDSEEDNW